MNTLHITNGDSVATTLRTFIADPVVITADVLHEGPAPCGMEGDDWHALRARFLAGAQYGSYEDIRSHLAASDRAIASAGAYGEAVLWFEHDLFDQLLLVRSLDLLSRLHPPARVSLICIGAFPGVDRFVGLGQLRAGDLATLVDQRQPVAHPAYESAAAAWTAFRAPDPSALTALACDRSRHTLSPLPFLRDALRRLLEEYPWTTTGLSRSAGAVLQAVAAGAQDAGRVFVAAQAVEARPFMGDTTLFRIINQLAAARVPLVTVEPRDGATDLRHHLVGLTAAGRDVIDGRRDAIALNGIDEWRGGVHLSGDGRAMWRWDPGAETLVS